MSLSVCWIVLWSAGFSVFKLKWEMDSVFELGECFWIGWVFELGWVCVREQWIVQYFECINKIFTILFIPEWWWLCSSSLTVENFVLISEWMYILISVVECRVLCFYAQVEDGWCSDWWWVCMVDGVCFWKWIVYVYGIFFFYYFYNFGCIYYLVFIYFICNAVFKRYNTS